jgi:hypothetical protein
MHRSGARTGQGWKSKWNPLAFAAGAGFLGLLAGCFPSYESTSTAEAPVASGTAVREDTRMTLTTLDQHCMAFGERYVNAVGNACGEIEQDAKDLQVRADAHLLKLRTAHSVYDILTGHSPFAKLMDLVVLVELQYRVLATDGVAVKVYGTELAPVLVRALLEGRADVWRVADLVLKPGQRKVLEDMIDVWRARNPDVVFVAGVRFSEFSEYRGKSILDGIPLGSGLLAPVSDAVRQMEETRLLAERGLFLTKRMPQLVRWEAEALVNSLMLHPEIRKLDETAVRVAAILETLPARVAEERAAIMKRMEDREKAIGAIAQDIRVTAADVKEIVEQFPPLLQEAEEVLRTANVLAEKFSSPEGAKEAPRDSHPFDIREFTATVRELRGLLESPAWTARLAEINQAAQLRVKDAGLEGSHLLLSFFWHAVLLLVLAFGLSLAYRLITRRPPSRPA